LAKRVQNYHPIYADAALPGELKDVQEDIRENDELCHFLGKNSMYSIFSFIEFTGLKITNSELYDIFLKNVKSNSHEMSMTNTFQKNLYDIVKLLWQDMISASRIYDVSTTLHKIQIIIQENSEKFSNENFSKIEDLYLVILKYLY
jgi:hypothetical protein